MRKIKLPTIHFVDHNSSVVEALSHQFEDTRNISVHQGNILQSAHNCVVSPANSSGFMDGGIDKAYRDFFWLSR